MSQNRLFIFDSDNNSAVCIGKGYDTGWHIGVPHIDDWFDDEDHMEFTGDIERTRFELITEMQLTRDIAITYQDQVPSSTKKKKSSIHWFSRYSSILTVIGGWVVGFLLYWFSPA